MLRQGGQGSRAGVQHRPRRKAKGQVAAEGPQGVFSHCQHPTPGGCPGHAVSPPPASIQSQWREVRGRRFPAPREAFPSPSISGRTGRSEGGTAEVSQRQRWHNCENKLTEVWGGGGGASLYSHGSALGQGTPSQPCLPAPTSGRHSPPGRAWERHGSHPTTMQTVSLEPGTSTGQHVGAWVSVSLVSAAGVTSNPMFSDTTAVT